MVVLKSMGSPLFLGPNRIVWRVLLCGKKVWETFFLGKKLSLMRGKLLIPKQLPNSNSKPFPKDVNPL